MKNYFGKYSKGDSFVLFDNSELNINFEINTEKIRCGRVMGCYEDSPLLEHHLDGYDLRNSYSPKLYLKLNVKTLKKEPNIKIYIDKKFKETPSELINIFFQQVSVELNEIFVRRNKVEYYNLKYFSFLRLSDKGWLTNIKLKTDLIFSGEVSDTFGENKQYFFEKNNCRGQNILIIDPYENTVKLKIYNIVSREETIEIYPEIKRISGRDDKKSMQQIVNEINKFLFELESKMSNYKIHYKSTEKPFRWSEQPRARDVERNAAIYKREANYIPYD